MLSKAARSYVGSVKRLDAMVIARRESGHQQLACAQNRMTPNVRKFDVPDGFFLWENPPLPFRRAIRHASEDDPRDLEPGISEAG